MDAVLCVDPGGIFELVELESWPRCPVIGAVCWHEGVWFRLSRLRL